MLSTSHLWLLPLRRDVLAARLAAPAFALPCAVPGGEVVVHFPPEWPGDPLPLFRIWHHGMAPGEDAVPGQWVVVRQADALAVGLVGTKGEPQAGRVEIGYGVNPAQWGQGYATEAVGALVARLLARGLTVTAETAPHNAASRRVLQKLGFAGVGERLDAVDGPLLCWERGGR